MKTVISEIVKEVVPSNTITKIKKQTAKLAFDLVEKEIKRYSEILGLEFGGSFAKGTWLSSDADIDIFIRFNKSTSEEKFERISKKVGFDSLKDYSPYVRYSQHPYVEAKIKNTKINIVPFYDVKVGEWKSAADRSPFHTKFMKKSLTPKMRNEVRVLKTFLKSNGIYGAEIAKQGFSGYIAEVLIFYFKNFEKTIRSMSEIKEKETIGKSSKKFETAIAIIDPIDNNRNLAAAISDENIGKFILISRAFKEKPLQSFFKNKKTKISKKHWRNLLVIKFNFKPRSPDIIWGQIKRATTSLSTQLELGGFTVLRSKSFIDQQKKACLFFLLDSIEIPQLYLKKGPEYFREDNSRSFIRKNAASSELMWIGKNREIASLETRKNTKVIDFMKGFLKNNLHTGIPKGLEDDFKRGYTVSVGDKNLSKSIKEAANELTSTDDVIFYFN